MIFDKNTYRLRSLEHQLANNLNSDKIMRRLANLKKKGPEWWIRYIDPLGKWHDEKIGSSRKEAEMRERTARVSVHQGVYNDPKLRDVKISVILEAYLAERMIHKKSLRSAKSFCKKINEYLGNASLKTLDENPQILV